MEGFGQRYREHMRDRRRPERGPEYWDARAAGYSEGGFGEYASELVARLDLAGCRTLLDVGSGPGTIALTVAPRLERVHALDFSEGMLGLLRQQARQRGLKNVSALCLGWEDDWAGVPVCDVAVASRSTVVPDLEAALRKLSSRARVRAYATYPAEGTMIPPALLRAIGREDGMAPGCDVVHGILRDLGFRPTLDYLPGKNRLAGCAGLDAVVAKVSDAVGELSATELARLRTCYDAHGERLGQVPLRWALFAWETRP